MCNLYENNPALIDWAERFKEVLGFELQLPAGAADGTSNLTYAKVVYPKYQGLFARPVDPLDLSQGLEPAVGRWGIVPFFHKGAAKDWKFPTNNARSEEMHEKASFRDCVKSRRCIIPASNIIEWSGPKGSKILHRITAPEGQPIFLAGLWAHHTWEGERTDSYSMVMMDTAEGHDMHAFHNRQPIFLTRDSARAWLDLSTDYRPLLVGPPAGSLAIDPPEPLAS